METEEVDRVGVRCQEHRVGSQELREEDRVVLSRPPHGTRLRIAYVEAPAKLLR